MNKIKSSKGFTLMEMLIVVAIIAVLVAIAIPTFTTSLNKARVATDEANIRAGYAAVMAQILTEQYDVESGKDVNVIFYLNKDGTVTKGSTTVTEATDPYVCFGTADANTEIAGQKITNGWRKGNKVTYTYTQKDAENAKVVINVAGES